MRRFRDFSTFAVILGLLAALGGIAYLTNHPEAAILERAAGWPVVGPVAEAFRAAYLGPPPAPGGRQADVRTPVTEAEGRDAPPPSALSSARRFDARPWVWLPEDTAIRREPRPEAPLVARTGALTNLPLLERRADGWSRVRVGLEEGWAQLEPPAPESREPPLGSAPEPVLPVPARPPDPQRLATGWELMGPAARRARLGPYELLTDLPAGPTLELLSALAVQHEGVYRGRYRLEPVGEPAEAVLLFARETDYRAFQALSEELAGLPAAGHAGAGLVALYAEGSTPLGLGETLLHELTHLLNRRALGPALPPWLDEGLCDDIAHSRVGPDGRLEPGTLGGEERIRGQVVERRGALAAATALRRALEAGAVPRLPELLALDWEGFVRSERRELHYASASFLVRYLLSGVDPALTEGFRAFLAGVARGEPATGEALLARLGLDWTAVELRWSAWARLATLAVADGPRTP